MTVIDINFCLWKAAETNDVSSLAARLLESDTTIDMFNDVGETALHRAVSHKNINAVQFLLENGADINLRDKESGYTPLHRAFLSESVEISLLLLESGASLGDEIPNQSRPWHVHRASKKHMKSESAHPTIVDFDGCTPLSFLTSLPMLCKSLQRSITPMNGEVYSFGSETADFQLGYALNSGISGKRSVPRPRRIHSLARMEIVSISAGRFHSLAVSRQGRVFSWGHGRGGRLGHGDEEVKIQPTMLSALATEHIVSCSAGENHSMAISAKGALYCWGSDRFGQLGSGKGEARDRFTPRRLDALKKLFVVDIAAGASHSVALIEDGSVFTWGCNKNGQLMRKTDKNCHGNGDPSDAMPKLVTGFGSNVSRQVVGISAGPLSTLVIASFKLSHGNSRSEERAVYQSHHGSSTLAKVLFHEVKYINEANTTGAMMESDSDWKLCSNTSPFIVQVSAGRHHCVARCKLGRVYTWGLGVDALGTTASPASLLQPFLVDAILPENGGANAVEVQACESRTCVVMNDGSVFTWGCSTGVGTLGFGNSTGGGRWQPKPSRIANLAKVQRIATAPDHTLVISTVAIPNVEFFPQVSKLDADVQDTSSMCSENSGWEHNSQEIEQDTEEPFLPIDSDNEEETSDDENRMNSRILEDGILSAEQKQSLLEFTHSKLKLKTPNLEETSPKREEFGNVPTLVSLCQQKVASLVDIDNVISLSCFAKQHYLKSLNTFTDQFMQMNLDSLLLMTRDKWKTILLQEVLLHPLAVKSATTVKFPSPPRVSMSPQQSNRERSNSVSSNTASSVANDEDTQEEGDINCIVRQEKSLKKKIKHVRLALDTLKQRSSDSNIQVEIEIQQREEKLTSLQMKLCQLQRQKDPSVSKHVHIDRKTKPSSPAISPEETSLETSNLFYCTLCGIRTQNSSAYASHLLGKKHRARAVSSLQTTVDDAHKLHGTTTEAFSDSDSSSLLRSSYRQDLEDNTMPLPNNEEWKSSTQKCTPKQKKKMDCESMEEDRIVSVDVESVRVEEDKAVLGKYHGSQSSTITLGDFIKPKLNNTAPTPPRTWSKQSAYANDDSVNSLSTKPKSLTAIVQEEEHLRQLAFRHQLKQHGTQRFEPKDMLQNDAVKYGSMKQAELAYQKLAVNDSRWFVPRTASALAVSDIIQLEQEEQKIKDAKQRAEEAEAKEVEDAIALIAQKEEEEKALKSKWSCKVCTFLNIQQHLSCAMCGSIKPKQTHDSFKKGKGKPSSQSLDVANGQRKTKADKWVKGTKGNQGKGKKGDKAQSPTKSNSPPSLSVNAPTFCPGGGGR